MRSLVVAMAVLGSAGGVLAGCESAGDPYPVRPGGGGPGGTGDPPDAGTGDGAVPDELAGEICVVLQWDAPLECPAITLRRDVLVEDVTGTATAVSGSAGEFTLLVEEEVVTLRLGAELADGLTTTYGSFAVTPTPVQAPVVDDVLWDETLLDLLETDTIGAVVVYVVDSTGAPVAGATVETVGGAGTGRLYYDDGAGGWILDDGLGTGPDGIALILDAGSTAVAASQGGRSRQAQVVTAPGAVGLGRLVLPD